MNSIRCARCPSGAGSPGAIAGLAAVTPAAGYVQPFAALGIGALAGAISTRSAACRPAHVGPAEHCTALDAPCCERPYLRPTG